MNKLLLTTSIVSLVSLAAINSAAASSRTGENRDYSRSSGSSCTTTNYKCRSHDGQIVPDGYCDGISKASAPRCSCSSSSESRSSRDRDGGGASYEDTGGDGIADSRRSGRGSGSGHGDRTGGGGRVICTYFFLKGEICKDFYYADYEYTLTKIHPNTVKGYHFWAVPYVEKLYKNQGGLLEKIIRPIAIHRAEELAFQMGVRHKPNYLGKLFRLMIEPLCFIVGAFVPETDYIKLYTKEYLAYAAQKYEAYRKKRKTIQAMAGTPLASFIIEAA